MGKGKKAWSIFLKIIAGFTLGRLMMRRKSHLFLALAIIGLTLPQVLNSQILSPADIMERYGKAVVLIATIKDNKEMSLGSGFIVKADGVIITNYHVIEGAYPALVKIKAGDIFDDISIISFDARRDIAVIKIRGFDLPTVNLGNSNDARIGERVVVIGNPQGFENTVSDGLLSQQRDTGQGYFLHQISAPISAGSSGRPVFNQKGEVIVIATLSSTEGQNLNFSVPINYARGMITGPIKYSLSEFESRAKEPTFTSKANQLDIVDRTDVLRRMATIIPALYGGLETSFDALSDTRQPHQNSFDSSKYYISAAVYIANQMLKTAKQFLSEMNPASDDLQGFRDTLLSAASSSLDSSNSLIAALRRTTTNAYGATFPFPDWSKADSTIFEMTASLAKIDRVFIGRFVDTIRKDYPKLESFLLPFFLNAYEDRDSTPDQLRERDKRIGHLGILYRMSTREPVIWYALPGGPAAALIKRDDILLGVVNGPEFNTQMECRKFQMSAKPGETYKFRIKRNFKEITVSITLI